MNRLIKAQDDVKDRVLDYISSNIHDIANDQELNYSDLLQGQLQKQINNANKQELDNIQMQLEDTLEALENLQATIKSITFVISNLL